MVYLGFLREDEVLSAVGGQLGVPYITLWDKVIPRDVLSLLPEKVIRGRKVLPVARLREHRRGPLVVALADPADLVVLDELSFATGLDIRPVLASEDELEQAIESHLSRGGRESSLPRSIDLPEDTSPLSGHRRSSGPSPGQWSTEARTSQGRSYRARRTGAFGGLRSRAGLAGIPLGPAGQLLELGMALETVEHRVGLQPAANLGGIGGQRAAERLEGGPGLAP